MFERNVFDEYRLYCEQRFVLGIYEGFMSQRKYYYFVCVDHIEDDEIVEMIKMSNHLQSMGDHECASFVPTKSNGTISFIEGQNCVLFQLPKYVPKYKRKTSIGMELAKFHRRGKSYISEKKHSIPWQELWIHRLQQLEMLYENLAKKQKKSSFDQAFMTALPYYIGRTENAIQYMVDTELDVGINQSSVEKTICHYQFTPNTWLAIDDRTCAVVKTPIDLKYDHPSRDLAEYIRTIAYEKGSYEKIQKFINDYGKVEALSIVSWRYIYARLLFPIEFFQIIERHYYGGNIDEEDDYLGQLYELFYFEEQMEQFLRNFHEKVVPIQWQTYIPKVDWLFSYPYSSVE